MHSFRTLGTLDLTGPDGLRHEAILRQPRLLALLCHLVLAPAGVRRRSAVLGLLWPESDERRARHNLTQALYTLRQSLGDAVQTVGPDEIRIDRERLACDAVRLQESFAEGDWTTVLDLYGGEFAEGLTLAGDNEFQTWIDAERVRLRRHVRDAGRAAADQALASDATDDAISHLQTVLHWAPHDESVVTRLIDLLLARADRVGAVAAYRAFVERLHTELDLEPGDELRQRMEAVEDDGRAAGLILPEVPPGDAAAPSPATRSFALATVAIILSIAVWATAVARSATRPALRPEALAAFEVGLEALRQQDFGSAAPAFERALVLDSSFTAAALEAAWAWCRSALTLACGTRHVPRVDSLIALATERAGGLTTAQRHHLEALVARRENGHLSEYRAFREAARHEPDRYLLEYADVAAALGRWQEALDAAGRSPSPMMGMGNRWYISSVALHALGRHEEAVDSFTAWRAMHPEWERQFLMFEGAELGALGRTRDVFARAERRRAMQGGENAYVALLVRAAREMVAHGHDDAREVLDTILVNLDRRPGANVSWAAFNAHYLRRDFIRAREVLDSLASGLDAGQLAEWGALLAARLGETDRADAWLAAHCAGSVVLSATERDDFVAAVLVKRDNRVFCARVAAVNGRPEDARRFLADAFGLGLEPARILTFSEDLRSIRDDTLVRRTESM